ncbi:hypothetical protein [Reichenbachiella sp.]|uniref:hypothetical protein n=1 Tax=Reichenbachiella sp. TaxID=2184521 RepID=UPI00329A6595
MEENTDKNESEMTEEELASYLDEVIATNAGQMTRKEYGDLEAPETEINQDYKKRRLAKLLGFKQKSKKKDKGRGMDR